MSAVERYWTHNDTDEHVLGIELEGQVYQGYVNASYAQLTQAFGYSQEGAWGDEWRVYFDDGTQGVIWEPSGALLPLEQQFHYHVTSTSALFEGRVRQIVAELIDPEHAEIKHTTAA